VGYDWHIGLGVRQNSQLQMLLAALFDTSADRAVRHIRHLAAGIACVMLGNDMSVAAHPEPLEHMWVNADREPPTFRPTTRSRRAGRRLAVQAARKW